MDIVNGCTGITIDENGQIAQIRNVETGQILFEAEAEKRRLFHITAPSHTWASRPVERGDSSVEVTEGEDGDVLLRYGDLTLEGKPSGIEAEVTIGTPAGTDEIQMALRIRNSGDAVITGALFPWVNGWQESESGDNDTILMGPYSKKRTAEVHRWCPAWANGTETQEWVVEYPVYMSLPWIDISGEAGGVSIINYQREPRQFHATARNMAEFRKGRDIGLLLGFYPYVKDGEVWESPVIGISAHEGDWHRTADRYRNWSDGWFKPAPAKRERRESIGSEHVFFSYFDGTPIRPYETMPSIAATGREHGVDQLCVWERLSLGLYGTAYRADEDILEYAPDEFERIRSAVQQCVEEGSDLSALCNFRLVNTSLDVFREENLREDVQMAYDGTIKNEIYSCNVTPGSFRAPHIGAYCNVLSPFSEKYRQRLMKQLARYLDIGYTSLFYDQPFETHPDYSRKDEGCVPESNYAATLELVAIARQALRERHPDALLMGEQCDIFGSEMIDQWMAWSWSDQDIASAIRINYSLPQTIINCVIDSDAGLASHAFAGGLSLFLMTNAGLGTLGDAPDFARHIRKLAALRKQCAERTVHARFCDQLGLTVKTDDGIVAYSYESDQGPAVIIAAPERAGRGEVTLDPSAFKAAGHPENGKLYNLDSHPADIAGEAQTFELKKDDVLVWVV
ncbi:MAG: hypothetical protein ACYTGH_11975 [Planctomycetota bacterium]